MSLKDEFAADLLNEEIQEDLMHDIEVDGVTVKALVGNSMLQNALVFGGYQETSREHFKVPRSLWGDNPPIRHGSNVVYQGNQYQVDDIDPDETSPLIVFRAVLWDSDSV